MSKCNTQRITISKNMYFTKYTFRKWYDNKYEAKNAFDV